MGTCRNCKKEITLREGEKNCPNCGLPPYNCWNCKTSITGETKECPVCGYFYCFNCNHCSPDCQFDCHIDQIKGKQPREIVEYFYKNMKGLVRKDCPNGVPITHAKVKLRTMALKLKGFRVKNKEDSEAFKKRFEEIDDYDIGYTWVISEVKEHGTHGVEWREVSNLAVCMGLAKKKIGIRDDKSEYELFEKIEGEPCEFRNWDGILKKSWYCTNCKTTYSENKPCIKCPPLKKGRNKGKYRELKERESTIDFCQLPRNQFINKEDDNGRYSQSF